MCIVVAFCAQNTRVSRITLHSTTTSGSSRILVATTHLHVGVPILELMGCTYLSWGAIPVGIGGD
jgi:hypothetical protein